MTYSIRYQLLKYLIASLLLSAVVIGVFTYIYAKDEVNDTYDDNMKHLAETLINQNLYPSSSAPTTTGKEIDDDEFLIQIWRNDGTLLYSSHGESRFPLYHGYGYETVNFYNDRWRIYTKADHDIIVQIAQSTEEREDAIIEIAGQFIIPLLLQIPLLALLIWIVVTRGLQPIHNVSNAIKGRHSGSLQPLAENDIPSEIKPLVLALNDLLNRLGTALKAQRQFIADAAHELRTPLTAVQLQLDIVKRSRTKAEREDALHKLSLGIKRSSHLVRQLLSIAHQQPDTLEYPMQPLDLHPVLNEIIRQCSPIALEKNLTLDFSSTEERCVILGNEASIRTLVENLIDNAIRYTPSEGKIIVKLLRADHSTVVEVWDNGCGIQPQERQRVFDRFYRAIGTEEEGTGLGLSIVKDITDRHMATIEIHDGLDGKGLCIQVIFPPVTGT